MTALAAEKRRHYDRYFRRSSAEPNVVSNVTVPDNVERREYSAPCFLCGTRDGCRHRRGYFQAENSGYIESPMNDIGSPNSEVPPSVIAPRQGVAG